MTASAFVHRLRRGFAPLAILVGLAILPVSLPAATPYPPVPAVDPASPGGSLRFPEGNWTSDRAGRGLLLQPGAGITLAGSSRPQAIFALLRLPLDKRDGRLSKGIMGHAGKGGDRFRLGLGNPGHAVPELRNRFTAYQMGNRGSAVELTSAPWDEDAALVVFWHDGTGTWQLDWYSPLTGTRHSGTALTEAGVADSGRIAPFNIGGWGGFTAFGEPANPAREPLWDGEIGAVGIVTGALPGPEDWSRIAQGAPFRAVLPASALTYLREFDGTPASLAPGAGEATAPAVPVADTMAGTPGEGFSPGSTLRRQSEARFVTLDQKSAGMVFGLHAGETARDVPFSGEASGPVELRVMEAATGKVVQDWTPMPAPQGTRWSGSLPLPESETGWLFADARLAEAPEVIAHARSEFGVGYKFLVMGQSQTSYPLDNTTRRLTPDAPMSASVARLIVIGPREDLGDGARRPVMGRIGAGPQAGGDGVVAFLNQFRRLKPGTPFMLIDEAVGGTSMARLLEGETTRADRQWADITDKLDLWGRDVTAVLWNWLMNEGSPDGRNVAPLMSAMFLPGHGRGHSLVRELAPGWTLGVLASDRESRINGREGMRAARAAFAQQNGFTLGPVVSDYRIGDGGGAHPPRQFTDPESGGYGPPETFDHGSARFMQRLAVMALQTIGEIPEAAVHPYYANARLTKDRRQILINVVAVNGGRIYSPAPAALRSWYVKEPGKDGAFVPTSTLGAKAELDTSVTPPLVRITRAAGLWPVGTLIRRMDDGEKRADDDGAAEDAIHAGGIYESWPQDPFGFGFPVVGMQDNKSRWRPLFEIRLTAP
ncbi:hypothetical protein [Haematobacter massiliensis]|uniref:hypothetical protein n=1 Tax=Haematobacter massiliensis TaxID=195105 RepID=UPI0023F13969|nr:hypothetical protein [Haematobacter massiliensis]